MLLIKKIPLKCMNKIVFFFIKDKKTQRTKKYVKHARHKNVSDPKKTHYCVHVRDIQRYRAELQDSTLDRERKRAKCKRSLFFTFSVCVVKLEKINAFVCYLFRLAKKCKS